MGREDSLVSLPLLLLFFFFFNFLFYIGVWPISKVVVVSCGQQRELSHTYIYVYPVSPNSLPIQAAT